MTAPGEALGGGAQVLGVDRLRSPRLAMPVDGDGLHTFRRYPRISTIPPRTVPMRRNSSTFPSRGSWRKRSRWLHKLKALLKAIRMVVLSLVLVAVFFVRTSFIMCCTSRQRCFLR